MTIDVAEQKRLSHARAAGVPWKNWGPYLSERQWGTVREDTSQDGWTGVIARLLDLFGRMEATDALRTPIERLTERRVREQVGGKQP